MLAHFRQLIFEEFDWNRFHIFLRLFVDLLDEQEVDSIANEAFVLLIHAIVQLLRWVVARWRKFIAGLSPELELRIDRGCAAAVGKFLAPIQAEIKMLATRQQIIVFKWRALPLEQ